MLNINIYDPKTQSKVDVGYAAAVSFDPGGQETLIKNTGEKTIYISDASDVDSDCFPLVVNDEWIIRTPVYLICDGSDESTLNTVQIL